MFNSEILYNCPKTVHLSVPPGFFSFFVHVFLQKLDQSKDVLLIIVCKLC